MDLGKISRLEEFLSLYGRVLLKASLANIPIYFLSLYTIPGAVAKEVERLQREFLWGDWEKSSSIHLVAQKEVYKGKKRGGSDATQGRRYQKSM